MMNFGKSITSSVLASVLSVWLPGCNEGPGERAGRQVDKAVEKAGQEIEKVGEKTGQVLEKTGEKIRDTAKSATK